MTKIEVQQWCQNNNMKLVSTAPKVKSQVAFILTMPNNNSWNGKWSGEGKLYVKVRKLGKKWTEKLLPNGESRSWYYNFGDGWGANVEARAVDLSEGNRLTRRSDGYMGYEWMIDSILQHGKILNTSQIKELNNELVIDRK